MFKLSPSILAADFSQLGEQIKAIERAGAHFVHIDVMDGHFVPNISIGVPVVESIRKITDMTLDVHLMISEPEKYIGAFANAGADIINVHAEATADLKSLVRKIKTFNKRAAVTVKPKTDVEAVYGVLDDLDMVLIMSVEPGFGGQGFMPEALKKIEKLWNHIAMKDLLTDIEVDGGITLDNVNDCINAGANVIVAGSSIFHTDDIEKAVRDFYSTAQRV